MIARLSSLLVWALVALATVAWGLRMSGRTTPVPAHASIAGAPVPAGADLARLLGTPAVLPAEQAPPPVAESRFRLLGVVAPRAGQDNGLAVIAVDGKPARTTRLGREVEPGLVLRSVSHRRVELSSAGRAPVVLELPPLAEAQRGRPAGMGSALPPPPGAGLPPVMGLSGAAGAAGEQPSLQPVPMGNRTPGTTFRTPPPLLAGQPPAEGVPNAADAPADSPGVPTR